MNADEFNRVLERRLELIRSVLGAKAVEYAKEDRLHNFKAAAALQRCTPSQALLGMLTKHLVSLIDAIKDEKRRGPAWWDEKIGDALAYLVLLEAIEVEKNDAVVRTNSRHRPRNAKSARPPRTADR